MSYRRLDERTLVAGQIETADIAELAAQGITMIVNNRPDGEEPGQPESAEIAAAAKTAGLEYRYIPVAGGFSDAQVEEMAEALESGPTLAFCRSGTRSAYLWAMARARRGEPPGDLVSKAGDAGYDLRALLPYLGEAADRFR
jgi:uncharacterized protein (TIGR01244 family)